MAGGECRRLDDARSLRQSVMLVHDEQLKDIAEIESDEATDRRPQANSPQVHLSCLFEQVEELRLLLEKTSGRGCRRGRWNQMSASP